MRKHDKTRSGRDKKISQNQKENPAILWCQNYPVLQYLLLFLVITVSFLLWNCPEENATCDMVQTVTRIVVSLVILDCIYLLVQKEKKWDRVLLWLLIAGIVLRIGYMLYTPCTLRAHDLWGFSLSDEGHASYILHLYQGQLPGNNAKQFYHPPFYYFLSACYSHILQLVRHQTDPQLLVEAAKCISCFASCGTLLLMRSIGQELGLTKQRQCLSIACLGFLPSCWLVGGCVNNDSLAVFFIVWILYYTLKWNNNPDYRNTCMLALGFGLGIMTKMVVAVYAFPVGVVMLVKFWKWIQTKKWKEIPKVFFFMVVSVPLALWYPIRNLIKFNQPFNYVFDIQKNSSLYRGNLSIWVRFNPFDLVSYFGNPYNDVLEDYNVPVYALKGAVFGQYIFRGSRVFAYGLLFSLTLLVIIAVWGTVMTIKNRAYSNMTRFFLPGSSIILWGFFVWFNLRYPYSCTMDFRYLLPLAVTGSLMITTGADGFREGAIFKKWYMGLTGVGVAAFVFCSIALFI